MSKICLACDINSDDNSLLADLNKNDIPLWSKKDLIQIKQNSKNQLYLKKQI